MRYSFVMPCGKGYVHMAMFTAIKQIMPLTSVGTIAAQPCGGLKRKKKLKKKKLIDSNEARISPHVFTVANVIASPHRASVKRKLPQEFVIFITNLASLVYASVSN